MVLSRPCVQWIVLLLSLGGEESVQLVALYILFFREESSIEFVAKLSGTDANFEIPEKTKKEIDQWFDEAKERANKNFIQLSTDIVITDKPVVKSILDYADTKDFDLIVMGRGKNSHLKNLLMGTVTSGIVSKSNCPIMVIK